MNNSVTTVINSTSSETNEVIQGSIVLTLIFSVITTLTVIGNLLVVFAVLLVHKLRYPSNFLIVSLAASDLLVSIMVMPFSTYMEYKQRWQLGEIACDIYILFDVLLCTASILNLCAISVDRYLAVTRPMKYVIHRTPKLMVIMITIAWISSALVSIPPTFGFKDKFVPGYCTYSKNFIYQICACFSAFYLPLIVMLILYGRIVILARRIVKSDRERLASCSLSDEKRNSITPCVDSQDAEDESQSKKRNSFASFFSKLYCLGDNHRDSVDSTDKSSANNLYSVVNCQSMHCGPDSAPPHLNTPTVSITEATTLPKIDLSLERSPSPAPVHHFSRLPPHLTRPRTEDSLMDPSGLTPSTRRPSNLNLKLQRKSLITGHARARISLPRQSRASSVSVANLPTGGRNVNFSSAKQRLSMALHLRKSRIKPNETKAIRTLGVIMGVFCICWIPFFIVALGLPLYNHIHSTEIEINPHLTTFFLWLGYANSTLNPLIYAIFNRDFRQPFCELLKCHFLDINARLRERRYHHEFGCTLPQTSGDVGGGFGRPLDTPSFQRPRNSTQFHVGDRRRSSMLTDTNA